MFSSMSGCDKNNECDTEAILISTGSTGDCGFLLYVDNDLYEPTNLKDYQNPVFGIDSQLVKISYERNLELPTCGGFDKITLFCYSNN
jgi:hypothetical protein